MLLGSEEGPFSESRGGAEGLRAWEAVLFPGPVQANAFCPVEGAPFPHKDPGTFCVNTGRKSEGLLGAAKGSAPLDGKLVAASFSYLRLGTLVFFRIPSEAQEGASGPAGSP